MAAIKHLDTGLTKEQQAWRFSSLVCLLRWFFFFKCNFYRTLSGSGVMEVQVIPVYSPVPTENLQNSALNATSCSSFLRCYLSLLSLVYLCQLRLELQIVVFHAGFDRWEVERTCKLPSPSPKVYFIKLST